MPGVSCSTKSEQLCPVVPLKGEPPSHLISLMRPQVGLMASELAQLHMNSDCSMEAVQMLAVLVLVTLSTVSDAVSCHLI
jgi:hypothetical protein